jgi:predicted  nucleic acid-binding Zn-ribbon protein
MTTYRSDILNSSNMSTNRLLSENDNLNMRYNQYKRNILSSTNFNSSSKSDLQMNPMTSMGYENYDKFSYNLSNMPDSDSDNKYSELKKIYDDRIKSLHSQVKQLAQRFDTDDILNTMKNDSIYNTEFITQRMKEIVDENFVNEKEEVISRLSEENAELRAKLTKSGNTQDMLNKLKFINEENEGKIFHLEGLLNDAYQKNQIFQSDVTALRTQLQTVTSGHDLEFKKLHDEYMLNLTKQTNELQKLKTDNLQLLEQSNYYEAKLKEISTDYEENKLEMDRLQKVISVLEIDLNSSESKLKDKQTRIESLQYESTNLQTNLFETNLKFKKIQDENKSLQSLIDHYEKERKDMLEKYSSFNDDLQKSHNEKLESQEKKNKEKYNTLKKKIVELKSTISNLEEEIKNEKTNSMNMKINYSKLYTDMQNDMKIIKNEWEKKLKEEQIQFEKILSELDNKHTMEINNLKHDHQIDSENKNRELMKLKQNSDLLKNFEKEFLRISTHEEIMTENILDMRRKMEKEIQSKEEELECELKRKLMKLEEDKKGEYDFLTENIRKNLKNLEKTNEELKESLMELQNKFNIEKETNENLTSNIANLQKNLRNLNSQLEEKENYIKNLCDKNFSYEESMRSFNMTNKSYKQNLDNLVGQIENLEKEIKNLTMSLKEKEEILKEELDLHNKTKSKLLEYENVFENLQNDNNYYINRCNELESNCQKFDRDYEDLLNNFNSVKENFEVLEKKNLDFTKQIKNLNFEKNNFNELIIKLIKSKSTSIRNELNSIKAYYNNECSIIKKEYAKTIETLLNKIKIFTMSFERDVENKTKIIKENLEKEFKQKIEEKENSMQGEIKKIEQKYEKHILEQFRVNEKLEKENKNLIETQQNNLLKCKEHSFKNVELESEIKNLNNQFNKLKVENDVLNETVEKLRMEKLNFNKIKLESEENGEMTKRETIRKLQSNLSSVLLVIVKLKKKYNQEIINLKSEIEELSKSYESKKMNFF